MCIRDRDRSSRSCRRGSPCAGLQGRRAASMAQRVVPAARGYVGARARSESAVELYDNPFSPYAFKVRAVLYEKGIAHEKCEIRTHADREVLLRVNPRGEVPALVD